MKELDRDVLKMVRDRITQVLGPLGEELGLRLALGTGTFSSNSATFLMSASTLDDDGVPQTNERKTFKESAHLYGLKATDLGRQFRMGLHKFSISGLKPRTAAPILATRDDGIVFTFNRDTINELLNVAEVLMQPVSIFTELKPVAKPRVVLSGSRLFSMEDMQKIA
jgi:hypothetical protein